MKKVFAALFCIAFLLSSCVKDNNPLRSAFSSQGKCRIMLWDERYREVYVPPTEFSVNGGWGELTGSYWRQGDSLTAVAVMPSSAVLKVKAEFEGRGLVWTETDCFDEDLLWAQERGLTDNGAELQFRHLSVSLVGVEAQLKTNSCANAKARLTSLSLHSLSKDVKYGMYLDNGSEYVVGSPVEMSLLQSPSPFVYGSQQTGEIWSGELYMFPQSSEDEQFVFVDLVWEYYLGDELVSTYSCSGRKIPSPRGKKLRLKLVLNPDEGKVNFTVGLWPWENGGSSVRDMNDATKLIEIGDGDWTNENWEDVNY